MSSKSVIVIGGGLAGLSSAVALADAGFRVRLLEQRPIPGRPRFLLRSSRRRTRRQLPARHAGLLHQSRRFLPPRRRRRENRVLRPARLRRCGGAAAAIMQASALARAAAPGVRRWLSIRRSLGASGTRSATPCWPSRAAADSNAGGDAAARACSTGCGGTGRREAAIDRFWGVVLVSALNEELDRIDARYGLDVFWKAFLANRDGYRLGVPRVPLGDLYDGCRAGHREPGRRSRAARARAWHARVGRARAARVEMDGGAEETADFYVLAVPHQTALDLLAGGSCRARAHVCQSAPAARFAHHRRAFLVRPRRDGRAVPDGCWTARRNGSSISRASTAARRRPLSATGHQRFLRSDAALAPGNHRSVPAGSCAICCRQRAKPTW